MGRVNRANKENPSVNGQPKRAVLGAIENKENSRSNKPLEQLRYKKDDKQQQKQSFAKQSKLPVPVVPVAQFEAFKVYEDDEQKKQVESPPKDNAPPEKTKNELELENLSLQNGKSAEKSDPAPMSVEKLENKENESLYAVVKSARSKDLFLEMDDYRCDIFEYLKEHEKRSRPKAGYMRKQPDITYAMRTILVDWLVEVAEEYRLHTETLYLAVNYIDRFLSFMSVVRSKLQLVGTAAMFVAAKYEEIYPPDVGEFVYITDDTYTKRQVTRMEILILKVLDFDMSIPTPYTFITAICIQHRLSEKVMYLAMFFSELALLETESLLETLPSIMASSSVALALHTVGEPAWSAQLHKYTGYQLPDLRTSIQFLDSMFEKSADLPQQAIQDKYKSGKYLHVASVSRNDDMIKYD